MKKLFIFGFLLTLIGCFKSGNEPKIIHGTKIEEINGFLDLKTFPPQKVEYDLEIFGEALIELGPKDYILSAVLYYDVATLAKLQLEYPVSEYKLEPGMYDPFNFNWLPENIKTERKLTPNGYSDHVGKLTSNPNTELWFLKKKVLVYYWTN